MCVSLPLSPGGPKSAGLPREWYLVGLPSSKVYISGERVFAPFSGESLLCLERGLGSARAQRHWPGGPLSPLCCSSSRCTVSPPVGDSEITGRTLTMRAWGGPRAGLLVLSSVYFAQGSQLLSVFSGVWAAWTRQTGRARAPWAGRLDCRARRV